MRRVAYSKYLLPSPSGKKQPHVSNWKMNAEQAAALGALSIVPGTTEIREIPETEAEKLRATMDSQSAGSDSTKPPPRTRVKPTTPGRYRYTDSSGQPRICDVSEKDGVLWAQLLDQDGRGSEFFRVVEMAGDFEGPD